MVHVPVSHTGPGHGGRRELAGECAWLLGPWAGWDQALGAARALRCLSPQPPRPCEVYRAEWELCRSVGHVLHHYYVHGKRPDCRQWLRDLTNCREWEESRSAEAQVRAGCGCMRRSLGQLSRVSLLSTKLRYQRDFRQPQLRGGAARGGGRRRKGSIERLGESNLIALESSA